MSMGLLYGLVAMFSFGINNSLLVKPTKILGNIQTVMLRCLITIVFLSLLLFFPNTNTVYDFKYILLAFIIGLFGYIPLASFYKSIEVGKIGVVAPIAGSSVVITILLSLLLFKESLSVSQIIAIILIVSGIILISLDPKSLRSVKIFDKSSGIFYAVIAAIGWGIVFAVMKYPTDRIGAYLVSPLIEFGCFVMSIVQLIILKQKISSEKMFQKSIIPFVFIASLLGAVASLAYNLGIKNYDVSIVAAITFANPLVATLLGRLLYKEKLKIYQYLAVIIIISGIVLINYS